MLGGHVHLSITHLTTFVAVVQYGSMSAAAIALTYSLSTVSTHVTQLERQLRTRLLERGPDGCAPTPAGRTLAHRAADLLDLHDEILQVGTPEPGAVVDACAGATASTSTTPAGAVPLATTAGPTPAGIDQVRRRGGRRLATSRA